jgi:hypothetical protein
MRYMKWFASLAMAAGMAVAGTGAASAQDWRDLHQDYNRADRLNAEIARDRARVNEDIRCGRPTAAAHDRAELVREQRELAAQRRDIRQDWRDRDYYRSWR